MMSVVRKMFLGIVVLGAFLGSQNAMAVGCTKPSVEGYDDLSIGCLNDGYALVDDQVEDYRFFVNKAGKNVFNTKWDWVLEFSDGLAVVSKNDKVGFINTNGKMVVPLQYDDANSFSEGLASVKVGDKWGFIDKAGKLVIKPQYATNIYEGSYDIGSVGNFSEGLAYIVKNEKVGFIDKTGKVVINPIYDQIIDNLSGDSLPMDYELISSNHYAGISVFRNGLAVVVKDGRFGFIDKTGKTVIPFEYQFAYPFNQHNQALVLKNGKYGVIDKTGKIIVSLNYANAYQFGEGLIVLQDNDRKWQVVDGMGKIQKTNYDDIDFSFPFNFRFGALVGKQKKYGFINKENGAVIIPLIYDNVHSGDWSIFVEKDDKAFALDPDTGKLTSQE